ncbi:NAD(P)/FAD-dependent oxidoreductase [Duganella aceris]|uniref:NAD(P)/FAD-dependent oxidoreductase n=1 Tax=Duganella aceris TaxID=2703883 RepID=A0ABX0FP31_9BURK|nr:NAD(P)/FAD-dependent oxidoreductase [Duganella aceris]NGZ86379.1 NAD(P)/FAD-dependent oxidoreductase [Duganella aceris]
MTGGLWQDRQRVDCLVIGGGPAGLTAALYLARFRLSVQVIDRGAGRAASIPLTRNYPGFPDGISGRELVQRIGEQAVRYGARITTAEVATVERSGDIFQCRTSSGLIEASTVILATGIRDVRPPLDDELHAAALAAGLIRYCPICDGFEVSGRRVAVIGRGAHGAREAAFIRSYTDDVTLLAWDGTTNLDVTQRAGLAGAGIAVVDGAVASARMQHDKLILATDCGELAFDAVYPALGAQVASRIAQELGAQVNEDGYLHVDEHQRTGVPGLYAIGDVVAGLNQISRATAQAATAATALRNDLLLSPPP